MSRIAYAVGNTTFRDCQYWPTILRAQIPDLTFAPDPSLYDEIWPVDVTQAQLMALSWRVKKWHLTGSITVDLTSTFTGIETTVFAGTVDIEGDLYARNFTTEFIACVTESDLLRRVFTWPFATGPNSGREFTTLGNDGIGAIDAALIQDEWEVTGTTTPFMGSPSPIGPFSGTKEVNMQIGAGFPYLFDAGTTLFAPTFESLDGPNPVGYGGALIPAQFVAGSDNKLSASANFNRNPVTIASAVFPFGAISTPGTFTVRSHIAPDFVVPIQVSAARAATGSTTSGTNTGDFLLEAVEFWPYDGTYNGGSGAQLLDPFRAY